MLVLTRRKNESIIINDNIKIVVIAVYSDRVRLGIEAPPEIPVHRREVFELIKKKAAERREAAAAPGPAPDNSGATPSCEKSSNNQAQPKGTPPAPQDSSQGCQQGAADVDARVAQKTAPAL